MEKQLGFIIDSPDGLTGERYLRLSRGECIHMECRLQGPHASPEEVEALCLRIVKARASVAKERLRKPRKTSYRPWARSSLDYVKLPRNDAGGLQCKPLWSPIRYDSEVAYATALRMWTRAVNEWNGAK